MRKIISIFFIMGLCGSVFAEPWVIAGSRPLGMGGAFVAVADGALAQQWNPAGLAKSEKKENTELAIYGGFGYTATQDLLDSAKKAYDIVSDVENTVNRYETGLNHANVKDLQTLSASLSVLDTLFDGNASILASANAGAGFKLKNFAVSINNFSSVSGKPVIDAKNIALMNNTTSAKFIIDKVSIPSPANQPLADELAVVISDSKVLDAVRNVFQITDLTLTPQDIANSLVWGAEASGMASYGDIAQALEYIKNNFQDAQDIVKEIGAPGAVTGSYKDNQTMVIANAAAFTEFALGYGHGFWEDVLQVGGNLKIIRGDLTGAQYRVFFDDREFSGVIKDAWETKETSYKPAVDIGLKLNLNGVAGLEGLPFAPTVGLVGKNINSPTFKTGSATEGNYKLGGQYRAGVAVNPHKTWIIAADIDLSENDTILDGYKSRQIALGTEVNIVNGERFNLPLRGGIMKNIAASDDLMFTAGLGLMFSRFSLELAGAVSTGSQTIDGRSLPKQAAAALNMMFLF